MTQAQKGNRVKVHYTLKLDDGTVLQTSKARDPLELTLGEGQLIKGFERALVGMAPGESKTARVPSVEAYGPRNEDMVLLFDRDRLPQNIEPEVGQQLELQRDDGRTIPAVVTEVTPAGITLDANHPLAGQDLTFEIEMVEVG